MEKNTDFTDVFVFRESVFQLYPALKSNGSFVVSDIADPTRFWNFYREKKPTLRLAKIFVRKEPRCGWICYATELYNPAQELREKWSDRRLGCCVDFPEMLLSERVLKNGARRYELRCPTCDDITTSALPHLLVKHLIATDGLEVYTAVSSLEVPHG